MAEPITGYLEGPRGPKGRQGPPGEPGPPGNRGPKGETGSTGETGDVGRAGPRGLRGFKGDTGPQGETGSLGPAGNRGPKGDPGESIDPQSLSAFYEEKIDRTDANQNELPVLQANGSLTFQPLSDLIDSTPVGAEDFGLITPAMVRAVSTAGQMITKGAYPSYLDLTAVEVADDSALFTVDTASDQIRVNKSGLYLISWGVGFVPVAGATQETYLTKNGGNSIGTASAGNSGQVNAFSVQRLSAGDYLQLICYVEGANVWIFNQAARNWISLTRVGL